MGRTRAWQGVLAGALISLSISPRAQDQTWTIGNERIQAAFRLTAAGLTLDGVTDPRTGASLDVASGPDSTITINGAASSPGSAAGNWILQGADASEDDNGSLLTFSFRSQKLPVIVERSYACYRQAPAIETWTTVRATGSTALTISNVNVWQLSVPATDLLYANGLRGDAADERVTDAFTLQQTSVGGGGALTLSEDNRSTEKSVPVIAAASGTLRFFGGLLWSGAWQMSAVDAGAQHARISAGLPRLVTSVDSAHPVELPHGVFGFTDNPRAPSVASALRRFIVNGLRGGRPFRPLVTDNTWFSYGTNIDDSTVRAEMAAAASAGVELFVVDAGWYAGAGKDGDFESGLGSWRVDPARFPDGLGALSDYAHDLGMQFGLWVEPERVNQSTVGKPGLAQNAWLAMNNGSLRSSTMAQICFGSAAARQWVLDRLTRLVDEARPDYLKWDNNMWINCTRSGHGHGSGDGNFAHVNGLYDVLRTLRERYPDLQIENCAQGGNRLDLGMLRYTDAAWIDDRSTPAVHVRHNLEGLSAFFPPPYLQSAMVDSDDEALSDPADIGLSIGSRMPGILAFMTRLADLDDEDRAQVAAQVRTYKSLRGIIRDASAMLLTPQADEDGGPAWDVLEEFSRAQNTAVVFAFQHDGAVPAVRVFPKRLRAADTYSIEDVDGRVLAIASGASLTTDGLEIEESPVSAARIRVIRGPEDTRQ